MATGERNDPFRAFNFQLEIDGVPLGAFSEVQRADRRRRRGRLPRRHRPAAERAQADRAAQVHQHHAQARLHAGQVAVAAGTATSSTAVADRRNGTIVLMNEARQPVLRWHAENAWINKIEGPTLQGERQRGRDRVGRARARRPDARDVARTRRAPCRPTRPRASTTSAPTPAPRRSSPLRTDIAGFVGIAERGPLARARCRSKSWRQFEAWFGDFTGAGLPRLRGARLLRERRPPLLGRARRLARPPRAGRRGRRACARRRRRWPSLARRGVAAPASGATTSRSRRRETHRAQTRTAPTAALDAGVRRPSCSVAGFARGTHVRVTRSPAATRRTASSRAVDADRRAPLLGPPAIRRCALPYEQPLDRLRPDAAAADREHRVHAARARARTRCAPSYDELSLVPEHPRYGPAAARADPRD